MNFRQTIIGVSAALTGLISGCANQAPVPVVDRGQSVAVPDRPMTPAEVAPGYYLVKKGDTLIRISLDNGQDYRDVAAWNNLEDPNKINVGQQLRVVPPEGVAVAKPVTPPPGIDSRAPVAVLGNGVKQEPKGGSQPYSDETLARLRQGETKPVESKPVEQKPVAEAPAAAPEAQDKPLPTLTEGDWAWPSNGKVLAPFNEASNKGIDLAGKSGDPVQAASAGKVVYAGSGLRGYGNLVIIKHDATYLSAYAHNSKILVKEGQSVTKGMKIAEVGNSDADQPKLHFEIRKQGKPVDPLAYLPKR
ncbi:peptidoglycan DD-metalloendopeptidase family protein [Denitratisoma sp. agr-D3]